VTDFSLHANPPASKMKVQNNGSTKSFLKKTYSRLIPDDLHYPNPVDFDINPFIVFINN
jgi:hypothetical protein